MKRATAIHAPLLRLVVCLIAGILLADWLDADWQLLPVLAVLVVAALLLRRQAMAQSVAICLCFLVLGFVLTVNCRRQLVVVWPDGPVEFQAVVVSPPVEKPKTVAVDLLLPQSGRRLKGYIGKSPQSLRLSVGDGLRLRARIQPLDDYRIGRFDYRRYLEVHGFTGRVYVAAGSWAPQAVALSPLSRLERAKLTFLRLRQRLLERYRWAGLTDREYAVVAAMTLGDKSALTSELRDVYSVTGASHVLALSGLHLGIIYTLLSLLVSGRRWRLFSQLAVVAGIWSFVLLVGMSPSVVRSAVMISVYALLSLGHRDRMSVSTLAFTALVMLGFHPYALFDVGFQLSFLTMLSILLWIPLFSRMVSGRYLQTHRVVKWLGGMVAVSVAAQLGAAPLIAYHFGCFSTCFLLTNFLVIPAATAILYLSVATLAFPVFAKLLLMVAGWLNTALTAVAAWPWASIGGLHPTVVQTVMAYVVIAACYFLAVRLIPWSVCPPAPRPTAAEGTRRGWLQRWLPSLQTPPRQ